MSTSIKKDKQRSVHKDIREEDPKKTTGKKREFSNDYPMDGNSVWGRGRLLKEPQYHSYSRSLNEITGWNRGGHQMGNFSLKLCGERMTPCVLLLRGVAERIRCLRAQGAGNSRSRWMEEKKMKAIQAWATRQMLTGRERQRGLIKRNIGSVHNRDDSRNVMDDRKRTDRTPPVAGKERKGVGVGLQAGCKALGIKKWPSRTKKRKEKKTKIERT